MISRLFRYVVWVEGTLMALNCLGIDLTGIAMLGSAPAVGLAGKASLPTLCRA